MTYILYLAQIINKEIYVTILLIIIRWTQMPKFSKISCNSYNH